MKGGKSAISNLVEAHSTPEEVQAFSGHQSKSMVEHYSREKNTREMSLRAVKKAEQYVNGRESK